MVEETHGNCRTTTIYCLGALPIIKRVWVSHAIVRACAQNTHTHAHMNAVQSSSSSAGIIYTQFNAFLLVVFDLEIIENLVLMLATELQPSSHCPESSQ